MVDGSGLGITEAASDHHSWNYCWASYSGDLGSQHGSAANTDNLYRSNRVLLESRPSQYRFPIPLTSRSRYYWFAVGVICLVSCLSAVVGEARSHSTYKVHGTCYCDHLNANSAPYRGETP